MDVNEYVKDKVKQLQKKDLLQLLKSDQPVETFQILLDVSGFTYVGSPIHDRDIFTKYIPDFKMTDEQYNTLYYETIVYNENLDILLVCFLGSQGSGSYGFELTKDNLLNHFEQAIKKCEED